jgi:hypothetical protein
MGALCVVIVKLLLVAPEAGRPRLYFSGSNRSPPAG